MHLPIRLRLTLAFAVSMAILLAGAGAFLYVRLEGQLLSATDSALQAQANVVAAGIGQSGEPAAPTELPTTGTETFTQVLDASGRIISRENMSSVPLVNAAELASVSDPTFLERSVTGLEGTARLLIVPAEGSNRRLFVVVGTSSRGRQELLSRFLLVLVAGGAAALALASFTGWALAGAALRPVERLRREAEAVSVSERDRRLPVAETGDEIARLGTTLNSMLDRLHVAFVRERRFVADASHELRTPLTALKAELDLALSRPRTPPELEAALHSASEEADRLAALADDLLLYSTAQGGAIPVHREQTRLDELLRDVGSVCERKEEAAGVSIELDAPDEPVQLDAARVRQAVDNLVSNAFRHTPSGGRISVRVVREGPWVRLTFEDTGGGFPPDLIDRAFEPFARSSSQRAGKSDGAGLGLAIVRAVAEAHGGHATAENRTEGGARVTLVLRAGE